jgi:dihydrodipicolinate synthase/N-acetylneuraminate lyase
MVLHRSGIPEDVLAVLRRGTVIPAHPLALDGRRRLDVRRQRALGRYYIDAGAGGLAVGVHTTQFAIREAGLYEPVLAIAAETAADWSDRPLVMIAGLAGDTAQAVAEARIAVAHGYHAGLLSLAALRDASEAELIAHCETVAEKIPLIGFYLQPAVGGVVLPSSFWRRFAAIDNVIAIKIAPFNRYRTLDVVRGVIEAGAERNGVPVTVRIKGGLLGHWCVWTRRAAELLDRVHGTVARDGLEFDLLALDAAITDCNAAFFDVANDFRGCIAGCHEVLRRQGLLEGTWCLDPDETLSPGQSAEIDRVHADWPDLNDDEFVRANLDRWLA